jgi:hypothetical protein
VATVGTALATIMPHNASSHYRQIALWPTPSAIVAYTIDYQRQILDMSSDWDSPLLPEDFHWLLKQGAKVNEYERTDDSRFAAARGDLERGIAEMRGTFASRDVVVPGRTNIRLISRINGWCPADTVVR